MAEQEELDLAKVQEFIKGQVETYAKEVFATQAPQVQPQVHQGAISAEEQARRQLQEVLTPFIKPGLDAANLQSADTRDYVDFYSDPAVRSEKETVEKMFDELKNNGRPLPRRDIYDYLQGKLYRENPEEFNKKVSERKKQQLDAASGSIDMGAGALDRARNDPVWSNVKNMSLEDLEKALDGVTF